MEISPEIVFALIQSQKEFPVDFDDAWRWIGYARKGTAKDALTPNFQRGIDYEIFASDYSEAKKKGRGGHNRELIFLTTALAAVMRYILKAESDDRRGTRRKLYCIIAGSAVSTLLNPSA